jgi:hypothetical protein
MPQDDPRSDTEFNRQQRGGARSEQMRAEMPAAADAVSTRTTQMSARMTEIGTHSFGAGLRMQSEMFDTLQTIGLEWMERRTSEAEFALNLSNRFAGVRTFPDAVATYQQWLNEWLAMCNEDGRRFVADGRKIVATGMRCFTNTSPSAPS